MKILTKIGVFVLAMLIMAPFMAACGKPTATETPTQAKKITLADVSTVLNMSSELPASFERLDAATEGLSNQDMGLGPEFTEVELFLSEEPFQVIFAYYGILESQIEQAGSDAILQDEEQVKSMILEGMRAEAGDEAIQLGDIEFEASNPDVGDLAILGSGSMNTSGVSIGYDFMAFKVNKVYVFVVSVYLPGESVSLVPVARGIEQRIGTFSQ